MTALREGNASSQKGSKPVKILSNHRASAMFVVTLMITVAAGCDEQDEGIVMRESAREELAAPSCFGEETPAEVAERLTDAARTLTEPEHPACQGVGVESAGDPVLCDAVVDAFIDDQGASVKVHTATYAGPLPPEHVDGGFGLTTAQHGLFNVTCTQTCTGGAGTSCLNQGCNPQGDSCSSSNCGDCTNECVKTSSLMPVGGVSKN